MSDRKAMNTTSDKEKLIIQHMAITKANTSLIRARMEEIDQVEHLFKRGLITKADFRRWFNKQDED